MNENCTFDPQNDPDASAKFALRCIFIDGRFDEIDAILTDGHEIGGMEGEPGWILERRDLGTSAEMPGYENWPEGASFRAYVNPECFALGYPEVYLIRERFCVYVRNAIECYLDDSELRNNISSALRLRLNLG